MTGANSLSSHNTRYEVLDGMRGIAAVCVMICHFTQHNDHPFFPNAHIAVDLFFMLSGFVIAHSYGARLQKNMGYPEYIGKRFIRLYPMYILGVLIGAPVLYALIEAGLANGTHRYLVSSLFYNLWFLPDLNSFDIQNMGRGVNPGNGEVFPTNPPSWSLFFELIASMAFPFLYKCKQTTLIKIVIGSYLIFLGSVFIYAFSNYSTVYDLGGGWSSTNLMEGFPRVLYGFSFGVLIYSLNNKVAQFHRFASRHLNHPTLLYATVILIIAFPKSDNGLYPAVILALVAQCLVLTGSAMSCRGRPSKQAARFLGWLSYPLYCLHFPIGRAMFLLADRMHVSKTYAIFLSIAVTFIATFFLTKFYEQPLRKFLSRKLSTHFNPSPHTDAVSPIRKAEKSFGNRI